MNAIMRGACRVICVTPDRRERSESAFSWGLHLHFWRTFCEPFADMHRYRMAEVIPMATHRKPHPGRWGGPRLEPMMWIVSKAVEWRVPLVSLLLFLFFVAVT
jgi:hypothetical protein